MLACALVAAVACFAFPAGAGAATLTVTKTTDSADGTCNADCSLREAVIAANATADDDVIDLGAGTYELTIPGPDEAAAATGDLDVDPVGGDLIIVGAGRSSTVIDGNAIDRVLDVLDGGRLELRDFTITGGDPRSAVLADDRHGGGLRTHDGDIELSRVTFGSNTADDGGAIHQFGTGNPRITGDLVIFSGNTASGNGGAIYNLFPGVVDGDGQVILTGTAFTGNLAGSRGGAIFSGGTGHVSIFEGTFNQNSADSGGGAIWNQNESSLAVRDSEFTGNRSLGPFGDGGTIGNQDDASASLVRITITDSQARRGGALFNQNHAHLTLADSVIEDAEATTDGGIAFIQNDSTTNIYGSLLSGGRAGESGGATIHRNTSVVTIVDSTIRDSEALSADPNDEGGGIALENRATTSIHRSTISGNTTQSGGGGIGADSAGGVNLRLVNSTISGNTAATSGGGILLDETSSADIELSTITRNSAASGGGILSPVSDAETRITGSILSDNLAPAGPNCLGAMTSGGFNLDSGTGCGFAADGDIQNGNAELGPLTDNGGPTDTHMVGPSGDGVDSAGTCGRDTDQRGVTRPQGTACDIGSLEQSIGDLPDTGVDGAFVKANKRQKQKGKRVEVAVRAGAGEEVTVVAAGQIRVKGSKRTFKLKSAKATVQAGKASKLTLVPRNKKHSKAVLRLLSKKKRVNAQITVRFADEADNVLRRTTTIRLVAAPAKRG